MCVLLEGNHSHQEELPYYATSSHFNDPNSRKHDIMPYFTHIDVVITRNNEDLRPKYFFQPLRPPSPVRYHACLSLCETNQTISRK